MVADKRAVSEWLKSGCEVDSALGRSLRASLVKPVRVLDEGRGVARQQVHASHQTWQYKGLMFCACCGAVASRKAQLLTGVCRGWASKHGKAILESIGADAVPKGFSVWPAEAEEADNILCGSAPGGGRGPSL